MVIKMSESPEVAEDVQDIKNKVDSIESFQAFQLRAQKSEILKEIIDFFGNSSKKAEIYLAVDGEKSVSEIAESLDSDTGNVSRHLSSLEGLIEVKEVFDGNKIYKKKKQARVLDLSGKLRSEFELDG